MFPRAVPMLYVALLLGAAVIALPDTARADSYAGIYYHVDGNKMEGFTTTNADAGFYPNVAVDGNDSTLSKIADVGSLTSSGNACSGNGNKNTTLNLATPSKFDLLHIRYTVQPSGNGINSAACSGYGYILADNSVVAIKPVGQDCGSNNCLATVDLWTNITLPSQNITKLWFTEGIGNVGSGTYSIIANMAEVLALDKNATVSDPARALADNLASNLLCLNPAGAMGSYASDPITLPVGTWYIMTPAVMHTNGSIDSMRVELGASTSIGATLQGRTRIYYDYTSTVKTGAVTIWKVTTTQTFTSVYVKPDSRATVSTDRLCYIGRPAAAASAFRYVTTDLSNWGGSAGALWGYIYAANGFPIQSGADSDLGLNNTATFAWPNMTQGTQAFATGAGGQTAAIGWSTSSYQPAGNSFLVALGQTGTTSSSANYNVLINGRPAQAVANAHSYVNNFDYAIFLIDDVAVRNNLTNLNGTVGQSGWRPLGAEAYQLDVIGGFNPALPIYFGNTYGRDGHPEIMCLTLCSANLGVTNFHLPTQNNNILSFHVINSGGVPIQNARVLAVNNTTAAYTNATGDWNWTNVSQDTMYTISASGYTQTCASYYFFNAGGATGGSKDSLGCAWVRAFNASYNVTLYKPEEVNLGGNGSVTINNTLNLIVFNLTDPTFNVGTSVQVDITRRVAQDLRIIFYRLNSNGDPIAQGAPTQWTPSIPSTISFVAPNGRALETSDAGQYLLTVYDPVNRSTLAYDRIGVGGVSSKFTVASNLLDTLSEQSDAITKSQVTYTTQQKEKVATSVYLDFLTWMYSAPLIIPNVLLAPLFFMIGAVVLRFGRTDR